MEIRQAVPDDAPRLTEIAFAAKRHWGYDESLIELWSEASKAGAIPLPRIDERTYGDLTLSLLARSRAGAVRTGSGEGPREGGSPRRAPVYYRYDFSGGGLDSALASGPDVDLLFEAVASDPNGCETRAVVSLRQSLP